VGGHKFPHAAQVVAFLDARKFFNLVFFSTAFQNTRPSERPISRSTNFRALATLRIAVSTNLNSPVEYSKIYGTSKM
jgi:hypothetical protein